MELQEILLNLQKLKHSNDTELAHTNADRLLLETIDALMCYIDLSTIPIVGVVDEIKTSYGLINKWYA